MSGPQLAAWAATAVALAALLGVVILLVQVRRLRSAVAAPVPPADTTAVPERSAVREPTAADEPAPALGTSLALAAAEPARPRPVVALVQSPDDRLPSDPGPAHDRTPVEGVVSPAQAQIAAATVSHSLVRVAALSYGIRRALREENRDRVFALVRRDLQRRHKVRRRAARRAARVVPIRGTAVDREESAS